MPPPTIPERPPTDTSVASRMVNAALGVKKPTKKRLVIRKRGQTPDRKSQEPE